MKELWRRSAAATAPGWEIGEDVGTGGHGGLVGDADGNMGRWQGLGW